MRITVLYATYSNSTALAAQDLTEQLRAKNHEVTLLLASDATADTFMAADVVVLASPSWDYMGSQGMPHEDFTALQARLGEINLSGKKLAVLGLGDKNFTFYCGAVDHLEKWVQAKGGTLTVPSLKIDQYYVFENEAKASISQWAEGLSKTA